MVKAILGVGWMDFYMWQRSMRFFFLFFFLKTGNTFLGYRITPRVCARVFVCVLGSVLDQNVPSGFVLSLSHTLESFLLHQCSLISIKMLIYVIFFANSAKGIHMDTLCTTTDNFWCFDCQFDVINLTFSVSRSFYLHV